MSDAPRPIYAPIPARALADTRLSGTDLRLLAAIAAHDRFGKNGTGCFASQRRLAALIGAHEKAVARSAGRLVELGYTTSEKSPTNGRLAIYRVVYCDDDAAAMRGDGRSFTKPAALKLAPESGTGNKSATDSSAARPVENRRKAVGIGNRTATDQPPIGNSTKKKTERIQGAAPPNIFSETDNRSREASAGNEFDRAAAQRLEPPLAARAEAGRSRDEVWDGASLEEQIAVLHRLHEGARPTPGLLENHLCRLARGAVCWSRDRRIFGQRVSAGRLRRRGVSENHPPSEVMAGRGGRSARRFCGITHSVHAARGRARSITLSVYGKAGRMRARTCKHFASHAMRGRPSPSMARLVM